MDLTTRRRLAATVAPLLLLATACSGDDGDERASTVDPPQSSSGPADEPAQLPEGVLSQEQLEQALLTVTDLPTGYTQGDPGRDDDTPTQSDDPECAARFDAVDASGKQAVTTAEASFEGPGLGTLLEQSLASFDDEARLRERLTTVTELLSECPAFTMTDAGGVESTVSISPLSFPALGDETVALGLAIETPQLPLRLNLVVTRVGNHLQTVYQGGLAADAAALEQAARKGTEKLQAVA
jgi:hypothetical protein